MDAQITLSKPDPRRRLGFSTELRGVSNELITVGCFVAMQERGENGFIFHETKTRIIEAASVSVVFSKEANA